MPSFLVLFNFFNHLCVDEWLSARNSKTMSMNEKSINALKAFKERKDIKASVGGGLKKMAQTPQQSTKERETSKRPRAGDNEVECTFDDLVDSPEFGYTRKRLAPLKSSNPRIESHNTGSSSSSSTSTSSTAKKHKPPGRCAFSTSLLVAMYSA